MGSVSMCGNLISSLHFLCTQMQMFELLKTALATNLSSIEIPPVQADCVKRKNPGISQMYQVCMKLRSYNLDLFFA